MTKPFKSTSVQAGEVSIQAEFHPSGHWITVPLTVAGLLTLNMVLDSGSPQSALSRSAMVDLNASNLLTQARGLVFLLGNLEIQGHAIPDLLVQPVARLGRLGIDGALGLDFFNMFRRVSFDTVTLELTLTAADG